MGRLPLLLLALQLLALLLAAPAAGPPRGKGNRTQGAARRPPRPPKELNQTLAGPGPAAAPSAVSGGGAAPGPAHETCWGYYDVSGQWDKEFECNNSQSGFRYCCGTCYYRFCCNKRAEKLDQGQCRNYQSPGWITTPGLRPAPPDGSQPDKYDPAKDSTNATVYISCGAVAFVLVADIPPGHPLAPMQRTLGDEHPQVRSHLGHPTCPSRTVPHSPTWVINIQR
uniref:Shisa N-terminal domain-containing protein n=1 Tax=Chelydra serpentina TaxID=8475 RepID=A0A8C3T9G3_CHESE